MLTSKLLLVFTVPTEGWPGWVDLGCWLHTKVVYPSAMVTYPSKNQAQCWLTFMIEMYQLLH